MLARTTHDFLERRAAFPQQTCKSSGKHKFSTS
jgi:hypothetical protein